MGLRARSRARAGGLRGRLGRGLSAVLRGPAEGAPVRVFAVVGRGGRDAAEELALDPRLRFVDSPRSAEVLLLVGGAAPGLVRPAAAVHDQLARPRGTVWWSVGADPRRVRRLVRRLGEIPSVSPDDGPAGAVAAVFRRRRELLGEPAAGEPALRPESGRAWQRVPEGVRAGEPEILPDREPAAWRGVGPHGQGGEGMTGGTPYGRPMAERAPARDGLTLDRLPVRLGPFFPHLPPGLVLELALQGDGIQEARVGPNPFRRPGAHHRPDPFAAALAGPVPVAVLEVARAAHHLRWLARTLRLHGLPALGERTLRLAVRVERGGAGEAWARAREVRRLERLLRGTGVLRWATAGVGPLGGAAEETAGDGGRGSGGLAGLGPVARAAGLEDDLRLDEPVYRDLGFEPRVGRAGGDPGAWGRLLQRTGEAAQALALAGRTVRRGNPVLGPAGAVEAPRGRLVAGGTLPAERLLDLVPSLLAGCEWGDALAVLASLDLDLEEAGSPARAAEAGAPGAGAGETGRGSAGETGGTGEGGSDEEEAA